jgi:Putative auto-transporter adhesin, head GIN domain
MRNFIVLAVIILFVFTQQSCRVVNGNHNVVTETRSIGSFSQIRLGGFANVHLTQGPSTDLKITGESNIINYVRTRVEGDVLIISSKNNVNLNTHEPVNIYVSAEDIEKISVSGAGDLYGENKWELKDRIELRTSGAGKIKAELNSPDVEIDVSGAGDVIIAGETQDIDVHVSGAGKVKAENLNRKMQKCG